MRWTFPPPGANTVGRARTADRERTAHVIAIFEQLALAVGRDMLQVFEAGPTARLKDDASPVTVADERAEADILTGLARFCPGIPVVAEEAAAAGRAATEGFDRFILVDPLDGTREFISRRPEFTVNIALVEQGVPVAGVVYAPALGRAYAGSAAGAERLTVAADFTVASREPIAVRPQRQPPVAVISRSHITGETMAWLERQGIDHSVAIGSSLKFCLLAEGSADIYPRYGCTMEWDTAAGDAVLRAAGGMTLTLGGEPLRYGKVHRPEARDFVNPDFIARGG